MSRLTFDLAQLLAHITDELLTKSDFRQSLQATIYAGGLKKSTKAGSLDRKPPAQSASAVVDRQPGDSGGLGLFEAPEEKLAPTNKAIQQVIKLAKLNSTHTRDAEAGDTPVVGGIDAVSAFLSDLKKYRDNSWAKALSQAQQAVLDDAIKMREELSLLMDALVVIKSSAVFLKNPQTFLALLESFRQQPFDSVTDFVLGLYPICYAHYYQLDDPRCVMDTDTRIHPAITLLASKHPCAIPVCRNSKAVIGESKNSAAATTLQELAHIFRMRKLQESLVSFGMPVERAELICRYCDYAFNALFTFGSKTPNENIKTAVSIITDLVTKYDKNSHEIVSLEAYPDDTLSRAQGMGTRMCEMLPAGAADQFGVSHSKLLALNRKVRKMQALPAFEPVDSVDHYYGCCQRLFAECFPATLHAARQGLSKQLCDISGDINTVYAAYKGAYQASVGAAPASA